MSHDSIILIKFKGIYLMKKMLLAVNIMAIVAGGILILPTALVAVAQLVSNAV